MLAAAAHVAGLLLEIERANGRRPLESARSRSDGAGPLIGSSLAIRLVRESHRARRINRFHSADRRRVGSRPAPEFY